MFAIFGLCAAAGLLFRIYGLDRSLWLDEFGTLWAIESGVAQVFERVYAFHGQSPLYYLVIWPVVRLLGESELAMRAPSLLFDTAGAYILYKAGREWVGRSAGLLAAAFAWVTPGVVESAANARPYALALLGESIALYGFIRAVRRGDGIGRGMFVLGGAVLFGAHYALALPIAGLVAAYACSAELRRLYPRAKFASDIAKLALLAIPWLPHLLALRSRGSTLSWLGEPDYLAVFESAGALFVLGAAGAVAGMTRQETGQTRAVATALWLTVLAHAGALSLLAAAGVNMLDSRYLVAVIPPAALLAAAGILRVRWGVALIPATYAFALTSLIFSFHYLISGSFSRAGRQDWRAAVASLNARAGRSRQPVVLFRSGFVEADGVARGKTEPVFDAPLRSPGENAPAWRTVPLTYRWDTAARNRYFQETVRPAIEPLESFYILLCDQCYNETTGDYPNGVRGWIREHFEDNYIETKLLAGSGILLYEYQRKTTPRSIQREKNIAGASHVLRRAVPGAVKH